MRGGLVKSFHCSKWPHWIGVVGKGSATNHNINWNDDSFRRLTEVHDEEHALPNAASYLADIDAIS
jgi:hypothetical protein